MGILPRTEVTVRVWGRAGSIRPGHVVPGVKVKSVLASLHGSLVSADIAPPPPSRVSSPAVALHYVLLIQIGCAVTLAGTVIASHWCWGSHRNLGTQASSYQGTHQGTEGDGGHLGWSEDWQGIMLSIGQGRLLSRNHVGILNLC